MISKLLLLAAASAFAAAASATDVGVSISVGQPGFYGRIDNGQFPQPQLIYAEPIIIQPARPGVPVGRPIYLRVPPGHAKDWNKHCKHYNACGQPVYFVQDRWYNEVYAPQVRGQGKGGQDHPGQGADKGKGKNKGKGHD